MPVPTARPAQRPPAGRGSHLRHAVLDGSAGTREVTAPADRERAARLHLAAVDGFWCSTAAGGCGNRLILAAGTKVAPYFRHVQGQAPDCVSHRDLTVLQQGYLHLAVQVQLQQWLTGQGYAVTLEHRFTDRSRADVHITTATPPAEDAHIRWTVHGPDEGLFAELHLPTQPSEVAARVASQTLEVQLSSIPWDQLRERDARYRRHTDRVTWLFGRDAEPLSLRAREQDGVSFGVWPRTTQGASAGPEAVDGQELGDRGGVVVYIGTRRPEATDWVPLKECRFDDDGLWTPTRDQALVEYAAAAKARQEQDARAAREAEQKARERDAVAARRERMRRALLERGRGHQYGDASGGTRPSPSEFFAGFAQMFPGVVDFEIPGDGRWLLDLPVSLREPARFSVYRVAVLIASGPLRQLRFHDVADPEDVILRALEDNGFIVVDDGTWRRGPSASARSPHSG